MAYMQDLLEVIYYALRWRFFVSVKMYHHLRKEALVLQTIDYVSQIICSQKRGYEPPAKTPLIEYLKQANLRRLCEKSS